MSSQALYIKNTFLSKIHNFCHKRCCFTKKRKLKRRDMEESGENLTPFPPTTSSTEDDKNVVVLSNVPPMLKSLIPSIKLQLRLCNFLYTVPFEWDDVQGRLCLLRSKVYLRLCKAQMCLHVVYTLIMMVYFLSPNNQRTTNNSTRMIGFAFLVCFGATMLIRLAFWQMKKEVVHLFNNYISFENSYLIGCKTSYKGDIVSRALMTLGLLTSVGLPGLLCTILFVSPCKPPHLGYILFRIDDDTCATPTWPVRLSLLTFDTWMWANCITPACFFGFQVFFLGIKCLSFYIQLLNGVFRGGRMVDLLQWSSYTQDRFCFQVYQHLCVLAKLYNFCLQSIFIPTQITAACMVIIIGLYTCIKLHQEIPMPGFAFFPLLSCDGFAMIFISQVAAGVYNRSRCFVNAARSSRSYRRSTWFRKKARATNFIKIRFGSSNYIGQMTPLVYTNFCLTQTVSLVLLF